MRAHLYQSYRAGMVVLYPFQVINVLLRILRPCFQAAQEDTTYGFMGFI